MTTCTRHGTRVRIIADLPPFRCDGKDTPYVRIENIDPRSVTYGMVTDVPREMVVEDKKGQ